MLDAVYVDARKTNSIIAIRPKPPFKPVFQVAASHEGSDIRILNEPIEGLSVFLVETGESRTPPETTLFLKTLNREIINCSFYSFKSVMGDNRRHLHFK